MSITIEDDRPRVIAYIGNFDVDYSTESHIALSLAALPNVRVVRVPEQTVDWAWVPIHAKAEGVDFVMWTHTHGFAPEAMHADCQRYVNMMREIGIPTVGYHLDRWWGLEREEQVYEPFFTQDVVCTADGGRQDDWAGIGVNHVWMPPAVVHTEVGRGQRRAAFEKEIAFLGSWMNYGHLGVWPWRYEMVVATNKRYGSKFRAWPRNGQPIRGMAINDLYASTNVMIGDSCLAANATHYWSDRVPETLGRGGLLVHPRVEGIEEEFPIEQPIYYDAGDKPSFMYALEQALALEPDHREFMIDQAIELVRARHTYLVRMRRVLELVDALKAGETDDRSDSGVHSGDPQDGHEDVDQPGGD